MRGGREGRQKKKKNKKSRVTGKRGNKEGGKLHQRRKRPLKFIFMGFKFQNCSPDGGDKNESQEEMIEMHVSLND